MAANALDVYVAGHPRSVALMAEGRTNAAIARALFIQEATVVKHVSNIMTKLDLPRINR